MILLKIYIKQMNVELNLLFILLDKLLHLMID